MSGSRVGAMASVPWVLWFTVTILTDTLRAQTPEVITRAAETMTSATLARQLALLSADSLMGRETPSAALERTARYVAARFETLGLQPGVVAWHAADTPWLQRYPVPGRIIQLNRAASHVVFLHTPGFGDRTVLTETGEKVQKRILAPFSSAAGFVVPQVPEARIARWETYAPGAALLTGMPTDSFWHETNVADKVVLYLPPADLDLAAQQQIMQDLYGRSRGAVLLTFTDFVGFPSDLTQSQDLLRLADGYIFGESPWQPPRTPWAVEVRAEVLAAELSASGVDLVGSRTNPGAPALRELPRMRAGLTAILDSADATMSNAPMASNVVGILEGTDSAAKARCLILVAPLDQRDAPSSDAVRVTEAADASTVSLAGLLELARAFSTPEARPKYSVVFLTTSGGASGQAFWGSQYYTNRSLSSSGCTPFMVLALDLSVGGPIAGDSVYIAGLDDVALKPSIPWMAGMRPELGFVIADGESGALAQSDAFVFAQQAIPSLLIQGGDGLMNDGRLRTTVALDTGRAARLLRLLFYVGQQIGAGAKWPQLTDSGRRRFLGNR